jgi:membrane-bound lytic murein transglycosylase D
MKSILEKITLGLALMIIASLLTFATVSDADDMVQKEEFKDNYSIYSLPIPQHLDFAGETVPLKDPQVLESYDRELLVNTYWQSQTVLFIKRTARYFPIIEPILKANGIPEDFKYLPLIESGFMPVVSPAGAVGFWQIMKNTGKQYGLEINSNVDERYHIEKATQVACTYLKEAYGVFGSWTLAAASYNMGISGLKKQLARQKGSTYYDLTLNSETSRYVYRLLAVKEIMDDPESFGFHVREKDRYQPIETFNVKIDSTVQHVNAINSKYGINYRVLKFHNPWLRTETLPNAQQKVYEIKIPKSSDNTMDQPIERPMQMPAREAIER